MIAAAAARPVMPTTVAPVTAAATERASLLKPPAAVTADGMDDAMALLYALNTKLDALSVKSSERQVAAGTAAKKDAMKEQQDAIQRAEDARKKAEEDSHSFWHKLGDIAGVVGKALEATAVVALALSGVGAGVAVAVVALSVASEIASHVKGTLAQFISVGCGATAAILTAGGSGVGSLSTVMQGASAVSGGVRAAANGINNKLVLDDQADGIDASADIAKAQQQMALRQALIEDAIAAMKDTHESRQKTTGTIQSTMQINDATSVAASSLGRV